MTKPLIVNFPKGALYDKLTLPPSKSILNRLFLLLAMANESEKCITYTTSICDDSDAMVKALNSTDEYINIGAAGTAMRFLTAYFASKPGTNVILDGTPRMRERPISILVDALRACGAKIEYTGVRGFPPLKITGTKLHTPHAPLKMDASVSSQYISAMLMIAPHMTGGLTLNLKGGKIASAPYTEMTIKMMLQFGVSVTYGDGTFVIPEQDYHPTTILAESDWSAASYWYEIAALRPGSTFELQNFEKQSLQGDSCVSDIFKQFGVASEFCCGKLKFKSIGKCISSLKIDMTNCPDLAQTVIVTAVMLGIPFEIRGLESLYIKETNRVHALATELNKIGITLNDSGTGVVTYDGEAYIEPPKVSFETYQDHRMAMALAPIALKLTNSEVEILNPEVVSKSYPSFWNHLTQIKGFNHIS